MKEPIYKGPKKHHAAVFISDRKDNVISRIRIITSKNQAYYSVYCHLAGLYEDSFAEPCWFDHDDHWSRHVVKMSRYDSIIFGAKTYFLGYVRDTELEY